MTTPPLPAAEVAAIVAAYTEGAGIQAVARRFHRDERRVASALRAAGVTIRSFSEAAALGNAKRETPVRAGHCRACGIILAVANCGHHDGACCECWGAAAGMVRAGETLGEALDRWLRETRENDIEEWCRNIKRRAA